MHREKRRGGERCDTWAAPLPEVTASFTIAVPSDDSVEGRNFDGCRTGSGAPGSHLYRSGSMSDNARDEDELDAWIHRIAAEAVERRFRRVRERLELLRESARVRGRREDGRGSR